MAVYLFAFLQGTEIGILVIKVFFTPVKYELIFDTVNNRVTIRKTMLYGKVKDEYRTMDSFSEVVTRPVYEKDKYHGRRLVGHYVIFAFEG